MVKYGMTLDKEVLGFKVISKSEDANPPLPRSFEGVVLLIISHSSTTKIIFNGPILVRLWQRQR